MKKIMKQRGYLLIILAVIIIGASILFIFSNKLTLSSQEQACINSGGTIATASCCGSVDAFPNTCTLGACGCSMQGSHEVKFCSCEEGKCFNGTECVVQG